MDPNYFGLRLKELRIAAGMTQKQLSEASGLSQGSLANIEQGLRSPAWETVVALCAALDVKCDSFMQPAGNTVPAGRGRPAKEEATEKPPVKRSGK